MVMRVKSRRPVVVVGVGLLLAAVSAWAWSWKMTPAPTVRVVEQQETRPVTQVYQETDYFRIREREKYR